MFFLFSFLFFFFFISCFSLGILFLDNFSISLELLVPYFLGKDISIIFVFDWVSLFFFSFVSLISSGVFFYSKFYMDIKGSFYNSDLNRFLFLLFLFVVSMFFLVFSSSWVTVLLGWDGLGLISFLLVIYYNDTSSLNSGLITVLTNRVGDCFFILSFMFMFYCSWVSIDFLSFFSALGFLFFLSVGAMTKSAQLPFSSWLPAAMAAPTPVSSLVHSSTLVTAGVYLFIRFNYLFSYISQFILVLSLLTMFIAGVCALLELDFKKVVAMSTLSQLGFMIFSVSVGLWVFGFLHMMFHAFFKSTLFLSTGNLMHYLFGGQDSRWYGSINVSFFSKLFFYSSVLSLSGFPFSLGFYSKDTILGSVLFADFSLMGLLFSISCCLTVAYSFRLILMSFFNFPSFFVSMSFLDDFYFYLPVFLLFSFYTFMGNFFFYTFIYPNFFSFFECFLGILIILLGIYIGFLSPSMFVSLNFAMSIGFLAIISSSVISSVLAKFSFKLENSWSELFGGKGFMNLFLFLGVFSHWVFYTGVLIITSLLFSILFFF